MKSFLPVILLCFSIIPTHFVNANEVPLSVINKIKTIFNHPKNLIVKPYNAHLIEINLGAKVLFASTDAEYIFAGAILETATKTNIVEAKENQSRQNRISSLKDNMTLKFAATSESKHTITLFTDIDCAYCRRFHKQIPELNAKGISVNYIMLPRAGLNSKTYDKTLSVLCSDQPQENMTLAMNNAFSASNTCNSSLEDQYALAAEFNINSTPTMIFPDGSIVRGLMTPDQLLAKLEQ